MIKLLVGILLATGIFVGGHAVISDLGLNNDLVTESINEYHAEKGK